MSCRLPCHYGLLKCFPQLSLSFQLRNWHEGKERHLTLSKYSGPPLIKSPLKNGKSGLIRGLASGEGFIRYNYTEFVL